MTEYKEPTPEDIQKAIDEELKESTLFFQHQILRRVGRYSFHVVGQYIDTLVVRGELIRVDDDGHYYYTTPDGLQKMIQVAQGLICHRAGELSEAEDGLRYLQNAAIHAAKAGGKRDGVKQG